jgi:hypothetical protein
MGQEVREEIAGAVRHLFDDVKTERRVASQSDTGRQQSTKLLELQPGIGIFQTPWFEGNLSEQSGALNAGLLDGFDYCPGNENRDTQRFPRQ